MEQADIHVSPVVLPTVCRPHPSNGWPITFVAGCGLLSLLIPLPEKQTSDLSKDWVLMLFCSACFLVPAVLGVVWLLRARIIADRSGLRWRSLGRWRTASWAEVTDYYERLLPPSSSSVPNSTIETKAGQVRFDKDWSDTAALRNAVQVYALHARAQHWGIQGTRPEDKWPRMFGYWSQQSRWEIGVIAPTFLTALAFGFWQFVPEILELYQHGDTFWDVIPKVTLLLLMTAGVAMIIIMLIEQNKSLTRRLKQHIIVDPNDVTYEEGNEKVTFAWEQVTDYYIRGLDQLRSETEYVIETPNGGIEFSPLLKDTALLKAIVRRYATAAGGKAWRTKKDPNTLGGMVAKWSGGREGVGQRIYHYRTRLNRASLFGIVAIAGTLLLAIGIERRYEIAPLNNAPGILYFADTLLLFYTWCLWRYHAAQIRTDAGGIHQYTIFGTRTLFWNDIQDYYISGRSERFCSVVGADGLCIRFWIGITDVEELQREIARLATGSVAQAWHKKEEKTSVANR